MNAPPLVFAKSIIAALSVAHRKPAFNFPEGLSRRFSTFLSIYFVDIVDNFEIRFENAAQPAETIGKHGDHCYPLYLSKVLRQNFDIFKKHRLNWYFGLMKTLSETQRQILLPLWGNYLKQAFALTATIRENLKSSKSQGFFSFVFNKKRIFSPFLNSENSRFSTFLE